MKKIKDFDQVQEATAFPKLEPGPQIVQIIAVEDVLDREFLKIYFDIAHGDLKGEFNRLKEQFGDWPAQGTTYRSYKQKALPFFKRFVVAVEKSNPDFKFDFDEQKLVGKYFVANFGIEEYDNGEEIKTSVKMLEARSIPSYKEGKVEPPKPKLVDNATREKYAVGGTIEPDPNIVVDDDDLPF